MISCFSCVKNLLLWYWRTYIKINIQEVILYENNLLKNWNVKLKTFSRSEMISWLNTNWGLAVCQKSTLAIFDQPSNSNENMLYPYLGICLYISIVGKYSFLIPIPWIFVILFKYLNFVFFINVKYKISSFSFINALSRYLFSKCAQFLSFHLSSLRIHVILLFNLLINKCAHILKRLFPFEYL